MNVFAYRILLEEPLLAAALEGDPNSAETLLYIPGSVLRGALLAAYLRKHDLKSIDAADDTARALFFDGSTRFLNGYPLLEGLRALPAPLSWRKEKGKDNDEVLDAALTRLDDKTQWKAFSPGAEPAFIFANRSSRGYVRASLDLNVAVHTARNRAYGRPRGQSAEDQNEGENGAVFRYVSLAAGQQFEALILSESPLAEQGIKPLLGGLAWLGGSRSAGYGKVRLEVQPDPPAHWRECVQVLSDEWEDDSPAPQAEQAAPSTFRVTFLSDGLIRNEHGQWAVEPGAVCGALSQALGCKVEPVEGQVFLGAVLTGGFNRKWGLPLVQAQAVRMGSVLAVRAPGCTAKALKELEQQGLGERRTEGFGRVAVDWPDGDAAQWAKQDPTAAAPQMVQVTSGSRAEAAASQVAQRLLRARLDDGLVAKTIEMANQVKGIVPSQLNALVDAIQSARRKGPVAGRAELARVLGELNEGFFGGARVENKSLLAWLKERAADRETIVEKLGVNPRPRVGGVQAQADDAMVFEYNLRLAAAVLARAVKINPRQ